MDQYETIQELTKELREKDEFIDKIRRYVGDENFIVMKELLR